MSSLLSIKDVSFSFGKTQALSNVSLDVKKGDFIGLIGQNGTGKTTLLKLILGLYSLQTGSIKIQDTPIQKFRNWDSIGYVPQSSASLSEQFPASVQEIVGTGLLSSKRFPKRFSTADKETIKKALERVDALDLVNKRIGELSGGQQQRVLIARALITNPSLLILDEPTKGLDPQAQSSFYDLLGTLHKKGVTILLVSHDVSRITHHVNKVAVLQNSLRFYGSHEEFCKHPDHDEEHHCLTISVPCADDCKEDC